MNFSLPIQPQPRGRPRWRRDYGRSDNSTARINVGPSTRDAGVQTTGLPDVQRRPAPVRGR